MKKQQTTSGQSSIHERNRNRGLLFAGLTMAAIHLTACGGGGGAPADKQEASNTPPEISGRANNFIKASQDYRFKPLATDADGDSLIFSIQNRPAWASFDESTGGQPGRLPRNTD